MGTSSGCDWWSVITWPQYWPLIGHKWSGLRSIMTQSGSAETSWQRSGLLTSQAESTTNVQHQNTLYTWIVRALPLNNVLPKNMKIANETDKQTCCWYYLSSVSISNTQSLIFDWKVEAQLNIYIVDLMILLVLWSTKSDDLSSRTAIDSYHLFWFCQVQFFVNK